MKERYGTRILQCPKCESYAIFAVHVPFTNSRRKCKDCGYQAREEYFRAIPNDAVKKEFNPSRR